MESKENNINAMARKTGITSPNLSGEVARLYHEVQKQSKEKGIKALKMTGEKFVQLARNNHQYADQTGNLTSSIGYFVACEGQVVGESKFQQVNGKTGTGEKGVSTGRALCREIVNEIPDGPYLVGMAAMNYATHVEAGGRDVISLSVADAESYALKKLKAMLKRK